MNKQRKLWTALAAIALGGALVTMQTKPVSAQAATAVQSTAPTAADPFLPAAWGFVVSRSVAYSSAARAYAPVAGQAVRDSGGWGHLAGIAVQIAYQPNSIPSNILD